MQMTDDEIRRRYKEAKAKNKQIGILAQLNACSQRKIREIITDDMKPPRTERKQKAEEVPPKETMPYPVISAVRVRLWELEDSVNEAQKMVGIYEKQIEEDLEEWAALKEWLTAYDTDTERKAV